MDADDEFIFLKDDTRKLAKFDEEVWFYRKLLSMSGWSEEAAEAHIAEERERIEKIVETIDDRLKTLADIVDQAGFFLAPDVIYDSMSVKKVLAKPGADETLAGLQRILEEAPDFEPETLERLIRAHAEERGLSLGKLVQPVRVAVTGRTASPGIFETLSLLGRERSLARIEEARGLTGS